MKTNIRIFIDSLIAKGIEFQVGLRGSAQPIGPAKVERVQVLPDAGDTSTLYRMFVQAQMNNRPAVVTVPVVFDADDVVIVIEPPLNAAGETAIITPGDNGRTPGGLHIPGA